MAFQRPSAAKAEPALADGFDLADRRAAVADFEVREAFFGKLLALDAEFYDQRRTGDLMSRGINDLQLLQAFYGPGLLNALNTAIVYVGVLCVMLTLDVPLTLVALFWFPLLYLSVNRLSKKVYARSLAVQEQLAAISDRTQENLSGIQQVKIYFYYPPAQKVAVTGDFNDWDIHGVPLKAAGKPGLWEIDLRLPPGAYSYNFIVDGELLLPDPNAPNQMPDGYGGTNSILLVQGDTSI